MDALGKDVVRHDEVPRRHRQHRRVVGEAPRCRVRRNGAQSVDKGAFACHIAFCFQPHCQQNP